MDAIAAHEPEVDLMSIRRLGIGNWGLGIRKGVPGARCIATSSCVLVADRGTSARTNVSCARRSDRQQVPAPAQQARRHAAAIGVAQARTAPF
ncbi:hypothetical protein [Xanthomonas medicagonis]|uniref:hypothetical protein n=1 Tax=Xanthomonas medicagonis TaxID=3160841 RepID=UPI0035174C59